MNLFRLSLILIILGSCSSSEQKRLQDGQEQCARADAKLTLSGYEFPRFDPNSVGLLQPKDRAEVLCHEARGSHYKNHSKYCHELGRMYEKLKYEKCASHWYSFGCKYGNSNSCRALNGSQRKAVSNFQANSIDNNSVMAFSESKYHFEADKEKMLLNSCFNKYEREILDENNHKVFFISGELQAHRNKEIRIILNEYRRSSNKLSNQFNLNKFYTRNCDFGSSHYTVMVIPPK